MVRRRQTRRTCRVRGAAATRDQTRPHATRASADPTETRRTPRSASWGTVRPDAAEPTRTLTGFGATASTIARMSSGAFTPGAYKAIRSRVRIRHQSVEGSLQRARVATARPRSARQHDGRPVASMPARAAAIRSIP